EFCEGEGVHIRRAVGCRDAAARRQLDLRCTLHELLAHSHADLIRTVGDHGGPELLAATQWRADDTRQFPGLAEIAVTAGDGDHGTGWEDAWTDYGTLVDRLLEPKRRTAQVANGRETPH